MSKTQRNSIVSLINIILGFISVFLWYSMDLSLYSLLGGLLLSIIISQTIGLFLPVKQKQKAKSSSIKKNSSPSSKKSTIINKGNTIRFEDKLLTLPLKELNWAEFEHLCYLFYKGKGYKVEKTKNGADGGIDLVYFHPEHNSNIAVQVKFYSNKPINVDEIRKLDSAKKNYKCTLAEFITTTTYTQNAKKEADQRHIEWRDKNWIELFLLPWREKESKKRNLA